MIQRIDHGSQSFLLGESVELDDQRVRGQVQLPRQVEEGPTEGGDMGTVVTFRQFGGQIADCIVDQRR
jgi:hypothetical protein